MPGHDDLRTALVYAPPLAVPLAVLGVLFLGLLSIVLEGEGVGSSVREVVPILRVARPAHLVPLVLVLAPAAAFVLILAARPGTPHGGSRA